MIRIWLVCHFHQCCNQQFVERSRLFRYEQLPSSLDNHWSKQWTAPLQAMLCEDKGCRPRNSWTSVLQDSWRSWWSSCWTGACHLQSANDLHQWCSQFVVQIVGVFLAKGICQMNTQWIFILASGNVFSHQLIICVSIPVVLVRCMSFTVFDMPEHMSMLGRDWITLTIEACPFTIMAIWKTLFKFSKNWIIFVSSDINIIVKSFGRFRFWSCVILLNICFLFPWYLWLSRAFRWNWFLFLRRASNFFIWQKRLICLTLCAHCWSWHSWLRVSSWSSSTLASFSSSSFLTTLSMIFFWMVLWYMLSHCTVHSIKTSSSVSKTMCLFHDSNSQ